jgi:SWI/SNF-related matrix-associated actin-dependent regulator 1 of chromatin subfamily A
VPGGRGTDFTGASNLSELHDRIQGKFLLRRTKDELADQLPDKQRRSILVSMDEATSKEYKRAAAEFLKWVKDTGGVEAFDRARRAEALNRLTTLRRLAAVGKTEAFIEQCMQHLQSTGRPLIVMAHHREVTEAVTEALVQNGVKAAMYTGSESAVRKAEIKDWFQDGKPADAPPEARDYLDVLVCSITAAGVGLTLTRAQDMFFAERTWRPYDLVQAEDRIYRIGQKNNATITYYDAAGTIDEYLAEMLVQKMRAAEEVINGTDPSDEDEAASFLLEAMFHYKPGEHKRNPAELGDIDEYEWAQPEL